MKRSVEEWTKQEGQWNHGMEWNGMEWKIKEGMEWNKFHLIISLAVNPCGRCALQ